jgi:hypothetical protein
MGLPVSDVLTRPVGVVRRISEAVPASQEDRLVWDALTALESEGVITGIADLVELVAERLTREYRLLWYVDGGLWGPSLARRRAAGIVRAADGRLFEIL